MVTQDIKKTEQPKNGEQQPTTVQQSGVTPPPAAPIAAKVEPLTVKQAEVKPPAAITPKQMTNVDMFRQWVTPPPRQLTPAELAAEQKKRKRDEIFAAIGDGVSAMSNLFFTTRGAPNMYTGDDTASKRTKVRYDKLMKERQDSNLAYYQGLTGAMAADNAQADKDRNFRRNLANDKKKDEEYKEGIAHRDKLETTANERYNAEQEYKKKKDEKDREFKQQQLDQAADQHSDQISLSWASHNQRGKQIEGYNTKRARGKQLGFSDGQGNQVSIYDNVWKNSKQQVYDVMLEDLTPADPTEKRRWERKMKAIDTAAKKEDFVNQNWHKSPRASQLMLSLSKLDPATMTSEVEDGEEIEEWDPNEGEEIEEWNPNE